jgi:hypothetical protein
MSQQDKIQEISDRIDVLVGKIGNLNNSVSNLNAPGGTIKLLEQKIDELADDLAPLKKIQSINPSNVNILDNLRIISSATLPTVNTGTIVYNDNSMKLYGKDTSGNANWFKIDYVT